MFLNFCHLKPYVVICSSSYVLTWFVTVKESVLELTNLLILVFHGYRAPLENRMGSGRHFDYMADGWRRKHTRKLSIIATCEPINK